MKYALYTGCVAKGAGQELLIAANLACDKLGIELVERKDASCCGAGVLGEDHPIVDRHQPEGLSDSLSIGRGAHECDLDPPSRAGNLS